MKAHLRRGLLRSAVALSLLWAVFAVFSAAGGTLGSFLRWFDFLSPVPGLSGLAILIVCPAVVLLLMFAVRWIVMGFAGQTDNQQNVNPR